RISRPYAGSDGGMLTALAWMALARSYAGSGFGRMNRRRDLRAYGFVYQEASALHPPLQGEGRRAKRAGVGWLSQRNPTPLAFAALARAKSSDPPPAGEGEESHVISGAMVLRRNAYDSASL